MADKQKVKKFEDTMDSDKGTHIKDNEVVGCNHNTCGAYSTNLGYFKIRS